MDPKPPRRIILAPERKTQSVLKMSPQSISVDSILEDAMQTLAIEVATFRVKVGNGKSLDSKEARMLTGYVESLIKLKKEVREEERDSKLDKLSPEELMALAKKVLQEAPPPLEPDMEDEEND